MRGAAHCCYFVIKGALCFTATCYLLHLLFFFISFIHSTRILVAPCVAGSCQSRVEAVRWSADTVPLKHVLLYYLSTGKTGWDEKTEWIKKRLHIQYGERLWGTGRRNDEKEGKRRVKKRRRTYTALHGSLETTLTICQAEKRG